MNWKIKTLLIILMSFWAQNIWACHKGGAMGFAAHDPGAFSVDLTLSPIFTSGSTFGTAGCQNWDYALHQRIQFLETEWEYLSVEASQGQGERLFALSTMMGCNSESQSGFSNLVQERYVYLFIESEHRPDFIQRLKSILQNHPSLTCTG